MAPIQTTVEGGQLVPVAASAQQAGAGRISLAVLVDYIIQRTYHELTVLAELLPRKSDMERKIEIVQFASRTRQLFIRLLAVVKWASYAAKVYRCSDIMMFLEQQEMLFIDTADMLAQMAREQLVNARLPNFSLPLAVDVLTTGTFPRLPACIRDKIVPPDPVSEAEKQTTLNQLNNIIQYRLVTTLLPAQMRNLEIENGRVKFHVDHEFEVSLTLMGDGPNIPWRLLEIDILVQNKESGDSKSLVHPLQVQYIHQLVQSRLVDNTQPLHDLYSLLHSFCQSLQLEVLNYQLERLYQDRLGSSIRIDEYAPGRLLTLSYWRKDVRNVTVSDYTLTVQVDPSDSNKPLQVVHKPMIKDAKLAEQAIKSEYLSIERLLIHTIHFRAKAKLQEIKAAMEKHGCSECVIAGTPAVLYVPLLEPCMSSEQLHISVDFLFGAILTSLPLHDLSLTVVKDIEKMLNGEKWELGKLLGELSMYLEQLLVCVSSHHYHLVLVSQVITGASGFSKSLWYQLMLHRCSKTVQHLFAECQTSLPLFDVENSPLAKLSKYRVYVSLTKYSSCYVVVEMKQLEEDSKEITPEYYMMIAKPVTFDGATGGEVTTSFLKVASLIEFDNFAITHGPYTKVTDTESDERVAASAGKRKSRRSGDSATKKFRSWYYIPELAHVVAMCEEKIPFWFLGEELSRRGVAHKGLEVEPFGAGLVRQLVTLPTSNKKGAKSLLRRLIRCSFRVQSGRPVRLWVVEFVFHGRPLRTMSEKEQGRRQHVYFQYDISENEKIGEVVDAFLEYWAMMIRLYTVVHEFAAYMNDPENKLLNIVQVQSFNYKKLVLLYGPAFCNLVTIEWSIPDRQFKLIFGIIPPEASSSNCHAIVTHQLQNDFNQHKTIPLLIQVLHETHAPLKAIGRLPTNPITTGSMHFQRTVQGFTVIPQSATHIRIVFRGTYCLDVHCRGNQLVAVRDGAYSLFDKSKAMEGFTPAPGLKAFLNMYVDESASRRHLAAEDDNPPSPVEPMESFLSQQPPTSGSPAQRTDSLRFHHPMTPPSNPNTPASPHTSVPQHQSGYTASPGSGFPLTSPPAVNPSPSLQMRTPSPGNLLYGSSPSPAIHAPSPAGQGYGPSPHMPSPATFMQPTPDSTASPGKKRQVMQGVESGSPFPTQSPGTRLPTSPSVPGPSPANRLALAMSPGHPVMHSPSVGGPQDPTKMVPSSGVVSSWILPQRSWAAAIPTLLSHQALTYVLTPTPPSETQTDTFSTSPLERFLGCVFLRKQMQRVAQSEDMLSMTTEPGVIQFKIDGTICKVSLNSQTLQHLQLKLTPLPEFQNEWLAEDLQVVETMFERRIACPPYRPTAVVAFMKMLTVPRRIFKDLINIMKIELNSGGTTHWSLQWCWIIPPTHVFSHFPVQLFPPVGTSAFIIKNRNSIVFFLHLTRMLQNAHGGFDQQTFSVPILYELEKNRTQLFDPSIARPTSIQLPPEAALIGNLLKRFAEFNPQMSECSIYPAIQDLLTNLPVPTLTHTPSQGPTSTTVQM